MNTQECEQYAKTVIQKRTCKYGSVCRFPCLMIAKIHSKGEDMAQNSISEFSKEMIRRVEELRERDGVEQEVFARFMGVDLAQYKRYVYYECRFEAEQVVALARNYPIDYKYVFFGDNMGKYHFIRAITSEDFSERAATFREIAELYDDLSRAKSEVAELKKQRREKKLEKESKVDYMTGDGDVIETKSQV